MRTCVGIYDVQESLGGAGVNGCWFLPPVIPSSAFAVSVSGCLLIALSLLVSDLLQDWRGDGDNVQIRVKLISLLMEATGSVLFVECKTSSARSVALRFFIRFPFIWGVKLGERKSQCTTICRVRFSSALSHPHGNSSARAQT